MYQLLASWTGPMLEENTPVNVEILDGATHAMQAAVQEENQGGLLY